MTRFIDHTKPGRFDDRPHVYALFDHTGVLINVFREYHDAVESAITQVTGDPNYTFINNYEFSIYVEGDRGEVCIFVEELM